MGSLAKEKSSSLKFERPQVFCLGANHKSAPIELREKLYLSETELTEALPKAVVDYGVKELAGLSTCNRFELMGVAHQADDQQIYELFLGILSRLHPELNLSMSHLKPHTYLLYNQSAVRHLFSVASSLDSLVIGETQITGQFKNALNIASTTQTLGPILTRLGQEALATAKRVRTQTEIGRKPVSISHAAVDLAKKVIGDLSNQVVLIVGTGEMARLATKNVIKHKPSRLLISNRTLSHANDLIEEVGGGEAYSLTELPKVMAEADLVISGTGSQEVIITTEMASQALAARRHRPLFLIDIALPRDIDDKCNELDDVYLFEIDDLKQIVAENFQERHAEGEKAERLIYERSQAFASWLDTLAIKPILGDFRTYLMATVQREFEKTLGHKSFAELNDDQRQRLAKLAEIVTSRISGDASKSINSSNESFVQEQLAQALQSLFPLSSE